MARVVKKSQLTEAHRWGILTFGTIYTPGDERSRTNPGHGYPESWDPTSHFEAFNNEGEWKAAIIHLEEQKEEYVPFTLKYATVTTDVKINIE